eukprot:5798833-Pyramimonas_sp.AAC.1
MVQPKAQSRVDHRTTHRDSYGTTMGQPWDSPRENHMTIQRREFVVTANTWFASRSFASLASAARTEAETDFL